jgi:hypothetical protein
VVTHVCEIELRNTQACLKVRMCAQWGVGRRSRYRMGDASCSEPGPSHGIYHSCLATCDSRGGPLLSRKMKMVTYRLECCCAVVAILTLAASAGAAAGAGDVGVIWGLIAGRHCWIKCVEVLE